MKIRTKLNSLIIGIILAFLISTAVFANQIYRSAQIDKELTVMFRLLAANNNLSNVVVRLYLRDIKATLPEFHEVQNDLQEVFDELAQLKYLPKLDPKIAESLDVIKALHDLQVRRLDKLQQEVDTILQRYTEISGFAISFTPSEIPTDAFILKKAGFQELVDLRDRLESAVSAVIIDSGVDQIIRQNELIEQHITARRIMSFIISGSITLVIIVFSLIAGMAISRNIRKPLSGIRDEVKALTRGDLSGEFESRGNDEIAELTNDLSDFLQELKSSIRKIMDASMQNANIKQNLMKSIGESSSATHEITTNMESIQGQFSTLDSSVGESVKSIDDIRAVIEDESDQIQDQIAMVEQSTSSVTQMISSIRNVAASTEHNKSETESLVNIISSGGEKLRATSDVITAINDNIEDIRNMTNLIQAISSQTNLLAMNAAIEAAHAGESGRGFAVVADEIRKLAEASAQSSNDITASINSILDRIALANESAAETTYAYTEIEDQIHTVERWFTEIFGSMKELEVGGTQILEAMQRLQDVSMNVNDGSARVNASSDTVFNTITVVRRVSEESVASMREMAEGSREIESAMDYLVDLSTQMQAVSQSLDNAVSFFTLEKEGEGNEVSESGEFAAGEE